MLSEEKLLSLVERIYDAAADQSLWPLFLDDLAVAVDANPAALIYHDMTTLRASFSVSTNLYPECQRQYLMKIPRAGGLGRQAYFGDEGGSVLARISGDVGGGFLEVERGSLCPYYSTSHFPHNGLDLLVGTNSARLNIRETALDFFLT